MPAKLRVNMCNVSRIMTSYYVAKFIFIGGEGELVNLNEIEVINPRVYCRKQCFSINPSDITFDYAKNRVNIFINPYQLLRKRGNVRLVFNYRTKGTKTGKYYKVELKFMPNEYKNRWERKEAIKKKGRK